MDDGFFLRLEIIDRSSGTKRSRVREARRKNEHVERSPKSVAKESKAVARLHGNRRVTINEGEEVGEMRGEEWDTGKNVFN